MCGFVAVLSLTGRTPDAGMLATMTDLLAHRGPDDRGVFLEGPAGLGFRRLSILDLAPSGHQPMESRDGRYVIVFNGEIYNYVELRAELAQLGHTFRSSGDTEVLLTAYRQWGPACLERLNGMWAFVVYDRREQRLFGARDRFGVKPLFWYRDAASIVFSSEIKALRDSGYARLEVDTGTMADYLLEGRIDSGERTFYERVLHVPPGTSFEADATGKLRWVRYWSVIEAAEALPEPPDPVETYAELFEDAVRLRMRADVPVGVLLSGGLDSTSIICSMARRAAAAPQDCDLNAFCYMSPQFDETSYVEATLQQTGARLWRIQDEPGNLWADLERHLWYQDEPVHSFTSVVGYNLMRLARSRGVKVLLNGQGADEVLAGYASYFPEYWSDLLMSARVWSVVSEIRGYARVHGAKAADARVKQALQITSGRMLRHVPGRAALSGRRRAARVLADDWVSQEVKQAWTQDAETFGHDLRDSLRLSLEREPLPLYLRVEDRNSMAHSVEVRLPFLDYRLVALTFRLGSHWKLRDEYGKYLLRQAMRGRIPEPVRVRADKFGFPTAADAWFRGELYEPLRDLLATRSVREAGVWQADSVMQALERHRRGEINVGARLFDVAQLCMWLEGSRTWPQRARHDQAAARAQLAAAH